MISPSEGVSWGVILEGKSTEPYTGSDYPFFRILQDSMAIMKDSMDSPG
jgi:hypothetical protein